MEINQMTEYQIAWLAGLLEGEGSFQTYRRPNTYFCVYLGSTDRDLVETVYIIVGAGTMKEKKVKGNRQPQWYWAIYGKDKVRSLALAIYPYMHSRRQQQIDHILTVMECEEKIPDTPPLMMLQNL